MKVDISRAGVLHVISETELEAYALDRWYTGAYVATNITEYDEHGFWRGSKMVIDTTTHEEAS